MFNLRFDYDGYFGLNRDVIKVSSFLMPMQVFVIDFTIEFDSCAGKLQRFFLSIDSGSSSSYATESWFWLVFLRFVFCGWI